MSKRQLEAFKWLADGDTGISSESIIYAAIGIKYGHCDAPYDPADLGRCLRMMQLMPWVRSKAFPALRSRSRRWRIAIDHWDEIAESMRTEVGIDWSKGDSAPKTYQLMKEIGL